jgi:AraC family transcriptional regulator
MNGDNPKPTVTLHEVRSVIPGFRNEQVFADAGLTVRHYLLPARHGVLHVPRITNPAYLELCLLLDGLGEVHRQTDDGSWEHGPAIPGRLIVNPSDVDLTWRWDKLDAVFVYLRSDMLARTAAELGDIDPDRLELFYRFLIRDPLVEALIRSFYQKLQSGQGYGELFAGHAAQLLAIHLLQHYGTVDYKITVDKGGLPNHVLKRTIERLRSHLDQDFSLQTLAADAKLSPYHFARQFKTSVGEAPYRYLMRLRVEQAKQLLKTTDKPIADIALAVGYGSQAHFTTAFKQLTGTTPARFRREG